MDRRFTATRFSDGKYPLRVYYQEFRPEATATFHVNSSYCMPLCVEVIQYEKRHINDWKSISDELAARYICPKCLLFVCGEVAARSCCWRLCFYISDFSH